MNDFRQMVSLIKVNASCNYQSGFESIHSSFKSSGLSGNTEEAVPPPAGPALLAASLGFPSLELGLLVW